MGQSTEELSSQIAGTREELAADLDALQDRVSPSAIVERRKAAVRGRLYGVKDKVMGTAQSARDSTSGSTSGAVGSVKGTAQDAMSRTGDTIEGSPLAAGLVAFGVGVVIAALLPATDQEARLAAKAVETAKEQAQPLVEEARSVGQDIGSNVKDSATEAAEQIKSTAADSASTVRDEGTSSVESVRSDVQR
jgi:ElaB/YqjD/DUF883 family membrane-anchored ribosome-binding protein